MKFVMTMAIVFSVGIASEVMSADKTLKENVNETANDVDRGTRKAVRKVKDETCRLVNGEMKCAAQKVKHSIQNGADKVEDAVN